MRSKHISDSPKDTEKLAEEIGKRLRGGEVIELTSDLGGGKTTFTRGLAKGIGSKDNVSSPTFTISNIYKAKGFNILHLDFYRLHQAGIMQHQLHENINEKKDVVVIEWSNAVKKVLPRNRLKVTISSLGENRRKITLEAPIKLRYLLKKL